MEVHANVVMSTGLLPLTRHYSSRLSLKGNHRQRCLPSNSGHCLKIKKSWSCRHPRASSHP